MIGQPHQGAAALPRKRSRDELHCLRLLQGGNDVRTPAGGRDGDSDIARPTQSFDLARKDALETEVVSGGGECGRVGGQSDRGNGGAVSYVADGQFGRKMLGIGGTAAVSKEQQLATATDCLTASRH